MAVPLRVVLCSLAGVRIVLIGLLAWCVPLGRCVRTWAVAGAVPAGGLGSRVFRDGQGCLRWLSGGFGELPGGRPSVSGESLEAPGVQFMSVSKLCGPSARGPAGQKWAESSASRARDCLLGL